VRAARQDFVRQPIVLMVAEIVFNLVIGSSTPRHGEPQPPDYWLSK
jgi:hypothetical protein